MKLIIKQTALREFLLVLILIAFTFEQSFTQIKEAHIEKKKLEPATRTNLLPQNSGKFDSTYDFRYFKTPDSFSIYVGQTITFLPVKESSKTSFSYEKMSYNVNRCRNRLLNGASILYDEIANKSFKIVAFEHDDFSNGLNKKGLLFSIVSMDKKDTLFWRIPLEKHGAFDNLDKSYYNSRNKYNGNLPPVTISGFIEKIKSRWDTELFSRINTVFLNIATGQNVKVASNSKWRFDDILLMESLDGKYKRPHIILKGVSDEKIPVKIPISLEETLSTFVTKDQLNSYNEKVKSRLQDQQRSDAEYKKLCTRKFGTYFGNMVYNKEVKIGMTKEMVKWSWGDPLDINKTITEYSVTEQWIYSNSQYIYFDNGKLTAIQQ